MKKKPLETTIKLSFATKKKLSKRKNYLRDTYDKVINELLEVNRK